MKNSIKISWGLIMRDKRTFLIVSVFMNCCFATYSVNSAPPTSFDNWQINNGVISAVCPDTYSCGESDLLSGVYQRTITDSLGNEYIQQIIASDNNFASESFTNSDSIQQDLNGISVKLTIDEPDLLTTTIINTGWANTESVALQIEQEVTSQDFPNAGFLSQFSFSGSRDADDNNIGHLTAIRQEIHAGSQSSGFIYPSSLDNQVFEVRKASGSFVSSTGKVSLPCVGIFGNLWGGGGFFGGGGSTVDPCTEGRGGFGFGFGFGGGFGTFGGFGFGITPPGGTVTWEAGDEVAAIWIGQSGGNSFGGGFGFGGFGGSGGKFSYQSYQNLSNSEGPIAARNVFSIRSAIDWPTDLFGPEPEYIE